MRRGVTFCVDDVLGVLLLCWVVLGSLMEAGGNAEACGAGGELDVAAGDMVWNIFGVDEDVILDFGYCDAEWKVLNDARKQSSVALLGSC